MRLKKSAKVLYKGRLHSLVLPMEQPVEFEPVENEKARFRLVCMTIYDMQYHVTLKSLVDKKKLQYVAYGEEVCPTTGRQHLQAFAYAKEGRSKSAWIKLFKPHHIAVCNGTLAQNEAYCSKEGKFTEYGLKPMDNGKKRTLAQACEAVVAGEDLDDVAVDHPLPFVMYHNGLKALSRAVANKKMKTIPKDFIPEVTYIWGPPGVGKTYYVRELEPDVYDCPAFDNYKWKDGYLGQEAVMYDNLTAAITPVCFLKEIDRYPIQVSTKGGFVRWRPRRIYITSVHPPEELAAIGGFSDPREFTRRITTVKYISKRFDE